MNLKLTSVRPRPALPAGVFFLAALLGLAFAPVPARAEANVVWLTPASVEVAPGGTFEVAVTTQPPTQSVAAWVVEVAFDPEVVIADNDGCDPIDTPGGAVGASGCQVVDSDGDGDNDAAKIFGAVLFTRSELGLRTEAVFADLTFTVVGDPGVCSDLRVRAIIYADAQGEETGALVQDGEVCIEADAPPSGTAAPKTAAPPRTSEPTPPPTGEPAGSDDGGEATGDDDGVPGSTGGPQASSGESGAPDGATNASGQPGASQGAQPGSPAAVGNSDDDDGDGIAGVLVVVGAVFVLAVAGAGAWYLVKSRRPSPPAP